MVIREEVLHLDFFKFVEFDEITLNYRSKFKQMCLQEKAMKS